jgi:outer membrane protein, adhesin transport system
LRAERQNLMRQIARSLALLRSDARAGQDRLAAAEEAVAASAASVAAVQTQFGVGRATIVQVLDTQRDLVQAEEALAVALRDTGLSGYAALALTGDILDVFGITLPTVRPSPDAPKPAAAAPPPAGPAGPPAP